MQISVIIPVLFGLIDLIMLPGVWYRQLKKQSIFQLLPDIEDRLCKKPGLSIPAEFWIRMIRHRTHLSFRWKRNQCLLRSLLLYTFLKRSDYKPVLYLGCKQNSANLTGHAWVECNAIELPDRYSSAEGHHRIVSWHGTLSAFTEKK